MPDIFGVIADPTRRDLLVALASRGHESQSGAAELSVGELVDLLALSQPTVSKHLKVLRDAGLVRVREVGQHRNYSLIREPLAPLEGWLDQLAMASGEKASDTPAAPMPSRPSTLIQATPVQATPVQTSAQRVAARVVSTVVPGSELGTAVGRAGADVWFAVVDAMATFLAGPRRALGTSKRSLDR